MSKVKNICVVGGTHGNELTGVHLVKHWEKNPGAIARPSLSSRSFLANPKAISQNVRYVDQDLNRQFSIDSLNDGHLDGYEHNRAKSIDQTLGPKTEPVTDFIFDLHTTTANMGLTLVLNNDNPIALSTAFYIQTQMPKARIFYSNTPRDTDNFLMTVAKNTGVLIEVGPVPQGVVRHDIIRLTEQAVQHGLDYLELYNNGVDVDLPQSITAFQFVEKIPMPQDENGNIIGGIHEEFQGQDYEPLVKGDPVFFLFDGSVIRYEGDDASAAFINEAAYYDNKIAFSLMKPITLSRRAE